MCFFSVFSSVFFLFFTVFFYLFMAFTDFFLISLNFALRRLHSVALSMYNDSKDILFCSNLFYSIFFVRYVRRLGVLTLGSAGEEESMPRPQPPSW